MIGVLAQTFNQPTLDYHALAPEIILGGVVVLLLLVDLFVDEDRKWALSSVAGLGVLAAFIPIVTLALSDEGPRVMFGGGYVVDDFALVVKALFLLSAYVVILMSSNYIEEGDYHQGEYYFLLLTSVLGMVMMGSSRDLVSIFVALEFLSIPAYMLAAWRKRDLKSNEAGMKYFLLGVFASAVMLYGMSLLYGVAGTTLLTGIQGYLAEKGNEPVTTLAVMFIIVGFAFKVSAVPFHTWAPDTYEGAPTPITAFLSVASKAAGFVALLQLVFIGFFGRDDVWTPMFWVLAALTMTVGNLIALRQTNVVRLLAYSSVAQAGYMLVPFAVAGDIDAGPGTAIEAVVTYLLIYAAMNLGAFAVVMAVARKTRSGEIASFGGLFEYAPGLATLMSVFLFALAGIPPLGGWLAKFVMFRAVLDAGTPSAIVLGVLAAVNSVVALFYYASVAREMWMKPVPDEDRTPVRAPASLSVALGLAAVITIALGVTNIATRFGDLAIFAGLG